MKFQKIRIWLEKEWDRYERKREKVREWLERQEKRVRKAFTARNWKRERERGLSSKRIPRG